MGTQTLEVPARRAASFSSARPEPNSFSHLSECARNGTLGWAEALTLSVGRSVLIIAAQGIVASLLWLRSHTWSWHAVAKWWTVYGTLVDVGCLVNGVIYPQKGHSTARSDRRVRLRWGRAVFLGAVVFELVFPFFILDAASATRIVYGAVQPPSLAGLADSRVLPLWGIVYSLSVWWLVRSPTEEMTYR